MEHLAYDNFLKDQTKEQLIIFLHNTELQLENLREQMQKITGCREFGNLDGMNGICVDCSYNEKELFDKCWTFKFSKNKKIVEPPKEQDAVKPVLDELTGRIWLCGKCGSYVGFEDNDPHDPNEFDRFCRDCGTPVLWEGR